MAATREKLHAATALLQQERYRAALACLEGLNPTPEVLWRSGQAWLGIGDLPRAIALLQPAQTALVDQVAVTECGIDLAMALTRAGKWQDALDVLVNIAISVAMLDNLRLRLLNQLTVGRAHLRSGDPNAFLKSWEVVGPQLKSFDLKLEWVVGMTMASAAHYLRGNWQRANAIVDACLSEIAPGTFPRSVAMLTYQKISIGYYRSGVINALELKQLLERIEQSDALDLRADALFLQGVHCWTTGDWPAARHAFEEARAVYLQLGNLLDADLACVALARLDFDQADFAGALGWVARIASGIDDNAPHWAAGWAGLIEGWIHAALDNDGYAVKRLAAGWSHFSAMPQHDLAGFCALQCAGLPALPAAERQTWLARALASAAQSSVPAYRLMAERARGEHLLVLGDAAGARDCLAQALADGRDAGVLPEHARVATALVECELRLAENVGALNAMAHSANALQRDVAGFPELQARLSLTQAEIARRQNDLPAALTHLRAAAMQVRWMRALADDPVLSGAIAGQHEAVYQRGIALSLNLNDPQQAAAFIEGRRAQWLSRRITLQRTLSQAQAVASRPQSAPDSWPAQDALSQRRRVLHSAMSALLFGGKPATPEQKTALEQALAELQAAYAEFNARAMTQTTTQGEGIIAGAAGVPSIETLRTGFTVRFGTAWTAVQIEPAPEEKDAWLLMRLTPSDFSIETIAAHHPLDHTSLEWLSNPRMDWRKQMLAGHGKVSIRHRLATWLKLDAWLPQDAPASHTLIFAGCEPFNQLPLAALPCAGVTLAEKAVLRHAVSWQVAAQLCQAQRVLPVSPRALLVAPVEFGGRHAPLPASLKEVESLRALWRAGDLLLAQQATLQAFNDLNAQGTLAAYDVLHFATHVQFDPDWSRASGLALRDDEVWLQDVLGWRLGADMVCISGCEAARHTPAGGEEALGFEAALIAAGARNVISPQWPVTDAFAGDFIVEVMQRQQHTRDLAAALADVQRRYVSTHVPLAWAGWRVFGMG